MSVLFWLIIVFLIGIAIYSILPGLLKHSDAPGHSSNHLNTSIYQQKLLDLEQAHQDGHLDDESYATAQDELARSLLSDAPKAQTATSNVPRTSRLPAAMVALFIPLLAISLYLYKGQHLAIKPELYPRQSDRSAALSMEAVIEQLEKRLNIDDSDADTWHMLGRAYLESKQLIKAKDAFANAYERQTNRVEIILDYAEALVRTNDNQFNQQATGLIQQAFQLEPRSRRTRWLLSVIDMKNGNAPKAVSSWQALLEEGTDNADEQQMLETLILRNGGTVNTDSGSESDNGPNIQVKVSLAASISAHVSTTDSVFIFARAAQGPKMPLAVVKKQASELPAIVSLSDSQAMTPAMKLSNFEKIIIGARISKTGNAIPASGDFQSLSAEIQWKNHDLVELIISDLVP